LGGGSSSDVTIALNSDLGKYVAGPPTWIVSGPDSGLMICSGGSACAGRRAPAGRVTRPSPTKAGADGSTSTGARHQRLGREPQRQTIRTDGERGQRVKREGLRDTRVGIDARGQVGQAGAELRRPDGVLLLALDDDLDRGELIGAEALAQRRHALHRLRRARQHAGRGADEGEVSQRQSNHDQQGERRGQREPGTAHYRVA